jgi:RNA polymerase sigma factor (sigma-70 family)
MKNPLSSNFSDAASTELIKQALEGDKNALNELIKIHEPFIYNVAWKYTNNPEEAKDLTQEVLIKVVTKLSTFKEKSAFKTWVYRIVVNQFLQTKRRPMEDRWENFDVFSTELNSIPSPEVSPEEEIEHELRTKTARTRCMSGMLMCLTREQRLIYILGDVFNLDHTIGAEVFGLSKQNYRVKLSRTRKEFHAFMNQQCGLVNTDNPCRCSKKAKAMEATGKMQTDKKMFDPNYSSTIAIYSQGIGDEVADMIDKKYIEFFQRHPTKEDFDTDTVINEIVNDKDLHKYFE